jgi:hypothetical protein
MMHSWHPRSSSAINARKSLYGLYPVGVDEKSTKFNSLIIFKTEMKDSVN